MSTSRRASANDTTAVTQQTGPSVLPDLGTGRVALSIIIVAQVIAILIIAGYESRLDLNTVYDLLLVSAYVQAIALGVLLMLKLLAPQFEGMRLGKGTVIVALLVMAVTVAVTEAALFGLHYFGVTDSFWPQWHLSLLVRALLISALVVPLMLRYFSVHHHARLEAESKQAANLQALQSRIRPHFLFNSMNAVASMLRSDPENAEKALHDLADVFRVLLADARKLVPITAETELARQYLEVEKLRLGDRLQIRWLTSNVPRHAMIPSLTLQPLIENAIYHGIEPRFGGGLIKVEMWREAQMLNIMVTNPLPEVPTKAHNKGNKIAMDNLRQRLESHFGQQANLQAFEQFGNYHAKIKIPIVKD